MELGRRDTADMTIHVAFLRAINVGNRRVSMDRLRQPFEDLGLEAVSTFIASGNVVFRSTEKAPTLEAEIEAALGPALGFEVATFVRPASRLAAIVKEVPFPEAGSDAPVHIGFLKKAAAASARRALEGISNETDTLRTRGQEVFWLARNGMGRATVTGAALEKALGQQTTLRSLKMLRRLGAKLA
jgi:uncharacterized protein (DUF1697 family)